MMKNYLCFLIYLIVGIQISNAQIGINTLQPDPSSALDIRSVSKGLLIPSMSSFNRLNLSSPADGLMVYDTDLKMFFFWNKTSGAWYSLNPWSYKSPDSDGTIYSLYTLLNSNVGIGRIDPQQKLHVAGSVQIDTNLYVKKNATVTGNITASNVSATTLSGNGAGVTNVDAATLGSHPASYFGTATDVTTLQTNKADKTDLFSASIPVTVTASTYCGTYCSITASSVSYTQIGNIVFVSGSITILNSSPYTYLCAQLSNIPTFPAFPIVNVGAVSICQYITTGQLPLGGDLTFYNSAGYGNMVSFRLNNNNNFANANFNIRFQFFYHI